MDTLFKEELDFLLPTQFELAGKVHGAVVRKIRHPKREVSLTANEFTRHRLQGVFLRSLDGQREIAVIPRKTDVQLDTAEILRHPASTKLSTLRDDPKPGVWIKPLPGEPMDLGIPEFERELASIRHSWRGAFKYDEELVVDGVVVQKGLRTPQIGAIHATLGHWTSSSVPATIVMPTGTGKTETMLALLVVAQINRLLVVVPSDALRTQISDKFLELGVLKICGSVAATAKLPVVATLDEIPKTSQEIDDIFLRANVVVTTMDAVAKADVAVQQRMAVLTSHLFVDEAHHIGAKTWREFKAQFGDRLVLQFTATPYRTDGRRVDGKFIYNYPLRKAYAEGYFRKIHFKPVYGLDRETGDEEIISEVRKTLLRDEANGHVHLAMARCRTIEIAKKLHALYARMVPEFNPQIVHSKLSGKAKAEVLRMLRTHESRIIVCVDMLGEGFDLPDLKVAALHDKHKSECWFPRGTEPVRRIISIEN